MNCPFKCLNTLVAIIYVHWPLPSIPLISEDHQVVKMTKTQLPRIKGFSGRHRKCLYSQTDECSALRLSEQNCAKVCKIRLWQPSAAQTLFLILWSTDVAYSLETCSAREKKAAERGRERETDRQKREQIKDEETEICPDGVWVCIWAKSLSRHSKKKKRDRLYWPFLPPNSSISTAIILTLSLWMQDLGCCPPILAQLTPFTREKESREGG